MAVIIKIFLGKFNTHGYLPIEMAYSKIILAELNRMVRPKNVKK